MRYYFSANLTETCFAVEQTFMSVFAGMVIFHFSFKSNLQGNLFCAMPKFRCIFLDDSVNRPEHVKNC